MSTIPDLDAYETSPINIDRELAVSYMGLPIVTLAERMYADIFTTDFWCDSEEVRSTYYLLADYELKQKKNAQST